MLSVNVLILQYICPGLGAVISNLMCLSPVRDVLKAVKKGELGDLNPTPWIFMFGQSFGWVAYGIVHQNLWLFCSDCLGLLVSVWLNLSAIKLLYKEEHDQKHSHRSNPSTYQEEDPFTKLLPLPQEPSLNDEEEEIYSDNDSDSDSDDDEDLNDTERTIPLYLDDVESGTLRTKKRTSSPKKNQKTSLSSSKGRSCRFPCFISGSSNKNNKTVKGPSTTTSYNTSSESRCRSLMTSLTRHDNLFLAIATIWFICVSLINLIKEPSIMSQETRELSVATMASVNLTIFYCAPLSTISTVLSQCDSSSIHIPTMIANTVNASFWTAYGVAIGDFSIVVPNGLGSFFGLIQIVLCVFIPRKSVDLGMDVSGGGNGQQTTVTTRKRNKKGMIRLMSTDEDDDNISFPVKL
jgi:uncharacterized protein with PQ loop repeat